MLQWAFQSQKVNWFVILQAPIPYGSGCPTHVDMVHQGTWFFHGVLNLQKGGVEIYGTNIEDIIAIGYIKNFEVAAAVA